MTAPILEVRDLVVQYPQRGRPPFRAVDVVDLAVRARETLGLVGESGSGKSTIGRAILGLAKVQAGTVEFEGRDITRAGYTERRRLSSALQVVFQDPYSSLNPTRTIGDTLAETARVQRRMSRAESDALVATMLARVGLDPDAATRHPALFSGGQRQRIAIARALMAEPRLVICDEAVSALDLSVQAQVLNLLVTLQEDFGLSYLFIAHDLDVVRHVSHRIAVLYGGQVMEYGEGSWVYGSPKHPYTQALLDAAPVPDPQEQAARRARRALSVRRASGGAPETRGCPFAARCPFAVKVCWAVRPPLEVAKDGTAVACHRWRDVQRIAPVTSSPAQIVKEHV